MHKNKALIAPLGLVGITILSGVFLMSSYSYATSDNTDAVDDVSITVPVSCSMEGTGMNSHNANIVNGTYQADIGSTTLKAFCNDEEGFAIYAIGFTDDEYGKTVLTNSTLGSTYDIATGTATSGSTSNWAMKLATNTSATYALTLDNGFGSYSSVPATYTKVAHRDSGTDTGTSATGSELTSTYAAFMNQTQPAGTYTGQVKYTLVHPANEIPTQPVACDPGKICYNANGSNVVGEMGKQSASNNSSVDLWASNFSRSGYGFAGWNTEFDYSGNFYGPNETITTPSDVETNGLSLYAVWIKSAGSIQNWTGCGSLASGATTALTDERDNNTYAVAKLADGKCWMIENLRLADKDSSNNDINLDSTNTNNPSLPFTNTWWFSADNDSDSKPTSNHLSATTNPTTTAWCKTNSSNCYDQSMLATNNTTLYTNNTASSYSASSNVYSYGNYYNWYSATAGHGKYGSSYGSSYTAPGDICPSGWHLPTGKNAAGDFGVLDIALGGTGANSNANTTPTGNTMSRAYRSYPNNFAYSGSVYGELLRVRNSFGNYWSTSGSYSGNSAYYMSFETGSNSPGTLNSDKYSGYAIRCTLGSQRFPLWLVFRISVNVLSLVICTQGVSHRWQIAHSGCLIAGYLHTLSNNSG